MTTQPAQTTQKVSIRYLLDVAIGNPEPGIVNFNALYTVLQVMAEKLDIQNQNIEIDSSFCPVTANLLEDRSNASSERLVDHQIYDYDSEKCTEKEVDPESKKQDDRKVAFEEKDDKRKDDDRIPLYRSELKQHIDSLNSRLGKIEDMFAANVDSDQNMECLRRNCNQMQEQLDGLEISIEEVKKIRAQQEQDLSACRKRLEHDKLTANMDSLQREVNELKETFGKADTKTLSPIPNFEVMNELKTDFNKLQGQLMDVRTDICSTIEQVEAIKAQMANRRTSGVITPDMFNEEVQRIKSFIDTASLQLANLQSETAAQKTSTDELVGKMEELEKVKIDKDEIDELLSEKADYTMLQRKVSVENMNADRRKLEKQLSEMTDCFVLNEERVQKQIGDIKKFLGDQSFEDMLFDFKVKNDKEIQVVRDAVKRLAEMKPEVEAAAARLRNLACLSCDQEVVMRAIELNNLSKFGDAYVTQSISPEVALELHKLRDAGKINAIDASEVICDIARNFRHTGGMHTIITAKDRVAKMKRK